MSYAQRVLREKELSEPVTNWLKSRGYSVWTEIPFLGVCIDVVGRDEQNRLIAVEMKVLASKEVRRQAYASTLFTWRVYAAVLTRPRPKTVAGFQKFNIGLLFFDGEKMNVLSEPEKKPDEKYGRHLQLIHDRLDMYDQGGVAGLPQLAGDGPAQECYRQIQKAREENPNVSWRTLFETIPNHYHSIQSFRSSMYKCRDRIARRER